MTALASQIEKSPILAEFLGVEEVVLVREDLLPDGGGKKRRALESKIHEFGQYENIHILSYAGSHTVFTLSQLLPDTQIHLYGNHYGGGSYEKTMVKILNQRSNIIQHIGSSFGMTLKFILQKSRSGPGDYFMNIGGSINSDPITDLAVDQVLEQISKDFHHVAAVASGNLLNAIGAKTEQVTGVLTQPLGIRLVKALTLKNARGIKRIPLEKRIDLMRELYDLTGNLWDPIFMGSVFSYLKKQTHLPQKLCIWVTCPTGIEWDSP